MPTCNATAVNDGGSMRPRAVLKVSLGALGALAAIAHGSPPATKDFDELVNAIGIHCEFYPASRPADEPISAGSAAAPEVLVHYAGMNRDRTRARVVSTRGAGSREVVVVRTERAVHFVEHAAGMFMVTTVFGCNERDLRTDAHRCTSFGAVNTRHFDASVNWQPDQVFERYRHLASHGFCDHSFIAVTGR